MNAFNWISDFGITLLDVGQKLFDLLSYNIKIPLINIDMTVMEVAFTSLPVILIPILVYKAITG